MFGRKKSHNLVSKIRENKGKIKTLEEENKKMAKLALKDGKLEKTPESTQSEQPVQDTEVGQPITQQAPVPQMSQMSQMPEQLPPVQPVQQAPQYQDVQPQQPNPFDQALRQQIPQQQYVQTPNVDQQLADQQEATVRIKMFDGLVYTINMPGYEIQQFLDKITESIDNQSSIQFGRKLVNGRHIMECDF